MRKRLALLAAAGTAVLALSGCAQSGDVAARVGDATVSTSDVDFLTRMQCDTLDRSAQDPTGSSQPGQTVAVAQVRAGMVNTLVQAELNSQLAEAEDLDYDRATLRGVMEQFEAVVSEAAEEDQDRFRELVEGVYRGQLQVYTLAEAELRSEGVRTPDQQQVEAKVAEIQDGIREDVDVEVNPAYGPDEAGMAGGVDSSLSVPVGSFARQTRAAEPEASWVSGLPKGQRCG